MVHIMFRSHFSRILIFAAVLCALVGGVFLYLTLSKEVSPKEYVVTLTDNGFSPNEISIKEGDTVRFRSERQRPFWPASDLHPTHTIYPGFDSRFPIHPQKEWSFTFTQQGRWRYHDHLDPQHLGLVIVLGDNGAAVAEGVEDCNALTGPQKLQCFDQTLEVRLRDGGIESAFDYFLSIHRADPEVPEVCHAWAHRLGEVEYGLYKEGKEVELRPESSLCNYGYFHGFINAMVKETGSLKEAQQFCDQAIARSQEGLSGIQSHCVHGIGHSVATLTLENAGYVTDLIDIATQGADTCTELYADAHSLCIDGVLHELYLNMARGDYGLNADRYLNSGDIFFFCRDLSGALEEACYYESVTLWEHFIGDDKKEVVATILDSASSTLERSPRLMQTLARSFIETEILSGEFQDSVDACALVPEAYVPHCMRGFALGFVTHGEPGKMHVEGFGFCKEYYTGSLQLLCLESMAKELYVSYDPQAFESACAELVPAQRPASCARP